MAEEFNRTENNRAAGRIGGQARTDEKVQAARFNVAKARVAKDFYRRHPEARPQREKQEVEQ